MTGRPWPRTCPGCGWRFRPESYEQRFCSMTCAARAAMAGVYSALARFAASVPNPEGENR